MNQLKLDMWQPMEWGPLKLVSHNHHPMRINLVSALFAQVSVIRLGKLGFLNRRLGESWSLGRELILGLIRLGEFGRV